MKPKRTIKGGQSEAAAVEEARKEIAADAEILSETVVPEPPVDSADMTAFDLAEAKERAERLCPAHSVVVDVSLKSFFSSYKVELVYDEDFHTSEEARGKTFEYIEALYNSVRLHSTLGYLSPVEYEKRKAA